MKLSWLGRLFTKVVVKRNVPPPPKTLELIAKDFAALYPEATVGDWVAFVVRQNQESWRAGFARGYEQRHIGELDRSEPEMEIEEPLAFNPAAVVPLHAPDGAMRNVTFVDEDGRTVEEVGDER